MKVTGWRIFGGVIGTLAIGMLEAAWVLQYPDPASVLAMSGIMLVLWGLMVAMFFAGND